MIKAAIFDIDGILTDGIIIVNSQGEEFKSILFVDIDAFFELKRKGFKVGFLTGEDTDFCKYIKRRFLPDFLIAGCKNKLTAFKNLSAKYGLSRTNTIFVGDTRKDITLLKYLKYSFAPYNADKEVKAAAKFVLKSRSGEGVIKEAVDFILKKMR